LNLKVWKKERWCQLSILSNALLSKWRHLFCSRYRSNAALKQTSDDSIHVVRVVVIDSSRDQRQGSADDYTPALRRHASSDRVAYLQRLYDRPTGGDEDNNELSVDAYHVSFSLASIEHVNGTRIDNGSFNEIDANEE
jgi:hypothetical protein